jgi:hypothetical protein
MKFELLFASNDQKNVFVGIFNSKKNNEFDSSPDMMLANQEKREFC